MNNLSNSPTAIVFFVTGIVFLMLGSSISTGLLLPAVVLLLVSIVMMVRSQEVAK